MHLMLIVFFCVNHILKNLFTLSAALAAKGCLFSLRFNLLMIFKPCFRNYSYVNISANYLSIISGRSIILYVSVTISNIYLNPF